MILCNLRLKKLQKEKKNTLCVHELITNKTIKNSSSLNNKKMPDNSTLLPIYLIPNNIYNKELVIPLTSTELANKNLLLNTDYHGIDGYLICLQEEEECLCGENILGGCH